MLDLKEMRALSVDELKAKVAENKKSLLEIRFKLATKQVSNNREIVSVKKTIARLNTIIAEKERAE